MTDDQIKHMVDKFLSYRFPDDIQPDGGLSIRRVFNEGTPHEFKATPSGTNLLNAAQATEMVRHMLSGFPHTAGTPPPQGDGFDAREYLIRNALQPAFPGISPLPSIAGVCTQVDHILAGQQDAIAQAYVLLWSIVTDDPRQHRARHILLDAMGGQGSTRQKLAMEKYGADAALPPPPGAKPFNSTEDEK